jgi:hypothetical protein
MNNPSDPSVAAFVQSPHSWSTAFRTFTGNLIMQITLPDSLRLLNQAKAAGFLSVEQYVMDLLDRDADRVAILQGLADLKARRCRASNEVEAELRREVG